MAEALAFLISARASLQNISRESSWDPRAQRILASISEKVVEALSALDDFSLIQRIKSGSSAGNGHSYALPTWWSCLDDLPTFWSSQGSPDRKFWCSSVQDRD